MTLYTGASGRQPTGPVGSEAGGVHGPARSKALRAPNRLVHKFVGCTVAIIGGIQIGVQIRRRETAVP
jgi:hypothetical protein